MKRFYVSQLQIEKGVIRVGGSEGRHIQKVLRLKPGDEVLLFNGSTQQYLGTIIEEHPNSVTIRVQTTLPSQGESSLVVTLAQSLLKRRKDGLPHSESHRTWGDQSNPIPLFSIHSASR